MKRRLFVFLLFVLILGFLGLVGFAYLGDLSPDQSESREQVTIELD